MTPIKELIQIASCCDPCVRQMFSRASSAPGCQLSSAQLNRICSTQNLGFKQSRYIGTNDCEPHIGHVRVEKVPDTNALASCHTIEAEKDLPRCIDERGQIAIELGDESMLLSHEITQFGVGE